MKNGVKSINTGLYSEDALHFLCKCSLCDKRKLNNRRFFCMRDVTGEIQLCIAQNDDEILDNYQWAEVVDGIIASIAETMSEFVNFSKCDFYKLNHIKLLLFKLFKIDLGVIYYNVGCKFDEDVAWLIDDTSICSNSVMLTSVGQHDASYFKELYNDRKELLWLIDYIKNGFKSDTKNEKMIGKPLDYFGQVMLKEIRQSFSIIYQELKTIIYFRRSRPRVTNDDVLLFKKVVNNVKVEFNLEHSDNEFLKKINWHLTNFLKTLHSEMDEARYQHSSISYLGI